MKGDTFGLSWRSDSLAVYHWSLGTHMFRIFGLHLLTLSLWLLLLGYWFLISFCVGLHLMIIN
jgi:hypothetical protein